MSVSMVSLDLRCPVCEFYLGLYNIKGTDGLLKDTVCCDGCQSKLKVRSKIIERYSLEKIND